MRSYFVDFFLFAAARFSPDFFFQRFAAARCEIARRSSEVNNANPFATFACPPFLPIAARYFLTGSSPITSIP